MVSTNVRGPILRISGISKSFAGIRVLHDIDFDLKPGEVHAIVGENGAGKSTFIKILSGAYDRDAGTIEFEGAPCEQLTPRKAHELGIFTIYQERNLIPHLSVAENILLGNEPGVGMGVVHWKSLFRRAREILAGLHLDLDPQSSVSSLGSAEQQAVEIAKALYRRVRVVIMDEPTASLTSAEIDNLFDIIRRLKQEGVGVIYISHRLDEIFAVADRVTVLRDGIKVLQKPVSDLHKEEMVRAMVGEEVSLTHIGGASPGAVLYEARSITREGVFRDVSAAVHRGEILGISGMVGSGRTEVVRAMAGIDLLDGGQLLLEGRPMQGRPLRRFIDQGICFLPEDRDAIGLIPSMSVAGNTTIASLPRFSKGPLLNLREEGELSYLFMRTLDVQAGSIHQEVRFLSGGNRQKVMIAKWLCRGIEVFIMDEPTQGVDVGAREEIHRIMKDLVAEGKAIVMVSSDLDELMNMSHRIAVMRKGRLIKTLETARTTREEVLSRAIGTAESRTEA
jgi:ABC-type sugar transport system ATPase subunit